LRVPGEDGKMTVPPLVPKKTVPKILSNKKSVDQRKYHNQVPFNLSERQSQHKRFCHYAIPKIPSL
jgi:hypothetical protein